ncbi:unnamed protein product, partial [marine sediment metagenome]
YLNDYIDEFSAESGETVFQSNDGITRVVAYNGPGYKVITSSVLFGGLRDVDKKNELMGLYLNYLNGTTPVIDEHTVSIVMNNAAVSLEGNNILKFELNKPSSVKIDFYSLQGQLVKQLFNNSCKPGTYSLNMNNFLSTISCGQYILRLETNYSTVNKSFTVHK